MVNRTLLAAALTAAATATAASALGAPALRLGLPPPPMERHEHGGFAASMHANRHAGRQLYGAYDLFGGSYGYGAPYAAPPPDYASQPAAEPAAPPAMAAAATPYNSNKVCPVLWRWSARAAQAVRSWSYCNN